MSEKEQRTAEQVVAPCSGCGHSLSWHFADVTGTVRCMVVHSGMTDRGIIGIPWSERCACADHQLPEKPKPVQPELSESFKAIIRDAAKKAKGE